MAGGAAGMHVAGDVGASRDRSLEGQPVVRVDGGGGEQVVRVRRAERVVQREEQRRSRHRGQRATHVVPDREAGRRAQRDHHPGATALDQVAQRGGVQHPVDRERPGGQQAADQGCEECRHGRADDGHRVPRPDAAGAQQVGDAQRLALQLGEAPGQQPAIEIAVVGHVQGRLVRRVAAAVEQVPGEVPARDALFERDAFDGLDVGQIAQRRVMAGWHAALARVVGEISHLSAPSPAPMCARPSARWRGRPSCRGT